VTAIQAAIFIVARTMPMIVSLALTFLSLAIAGAFFHYAKGLSPKES
jgi:hypothetical protein